MNVLLDVNLLLACGWQQHQFHTASIQWLDSLESYALCPITELGFLRVSMSPAFGACFTDANQVLKWLANSPRAKQIHCDQSASFLPNLRSYKETTDAYLVQLAKLHHHKLATLDKGILKKPWAENTAFQPFTT